MSQISKRLPVGVFSSPSRYEETSNSNYPPKLGDDFAQWYMLDSMSPHSLHLTSLAASLTPTPSTRPRLIHSLYSPQNSVLSLAFDHAHVYSGSQSTDISVWDKTTWKLNKNLVGHTESVLVLVYAEDKKWLLSASGDSTVRVRNFDTFFLFPSYMLEDMVY